MNLLVKMVVAFHFAIDVMVPIIVLMEAMNTVVLLTLRVRWADDSDAETEDAFCCAMFAVDETIVVMEVMNAVVLATV